MGRSISSLKPKEFENSEIPQVLHAFIFLTELLSVEQISDKNVVFNDFMQIN